MPHSSVQRALRLLSASLCLASVFFISTSLAAVNEWSGQAPFGGNVNAIWPAQGTADKAWAMGTELYVTTDAGSSWSPVEADAGDGLIEANRSILINPNDGSNVHLLTATRLLESNDGGDTWSVAAEYDEPVGGLLEYGGTFSSVIYGSSNFGLRRSDDAGQTWTSLTDLRPFSVSFDFAPDPFDPLTAYISASGLYRSSDGGETWQPLTNGLASGSVLAIATDPSSQGTLYAYVRNAGVHKSIDGGDSWQLLPGSPSSFVTEVKVHPLAPARIYVSTLVSDVLVSPDAGLTWQTLPNDGLFGFESEVIAFDTTNADRLYLGTEWKGIFTTANGGTNWTRANNGFSAQGVYELSIGPQDGKVFAGLREGVATRERDGNEWTENEGPYNFLVEALVVDPVAPQHAYLGSNCCGIFETFDAGLTWNPVPGLTDDDITGLDIPEGAPKTLWITDSSFGLFGTRDGGETFDNYSAGLAPLFSGTVNLYAVDSVANQPDTLYVGANEGIFLLGADEGDGGIYRSDDGGLTWTRKSGGVLDGPREVYRIAAHPDDPESLIVGAEALYRSSDGGTTWEILDMPVSKYVAGLYRSFEYPDLFYAHGRFGELYRSSDGGDTFEIAPNDGGSGNTQAVHADPRQPGRVYRASFSSGVKEFTFATDVSVALGLPNTQFDPGESATLSALVTNAGAWNATATTLDLDLPAGFSTGSVLTSQGNCDASDGIHCAFGPVAPDATVSVLIELIAGASGGGDLTAIVRAAEEELTPDNNDSLLALAINGGPDSDGDGIADAQDNCSAIANAAQTDADSDGYGNACDADFNNDCVVNVVDLGLMRLAFFGADPVIDLNGDGVVNVVDLGLLRQRFFLAPGPSGVSGVCG